MVPRLIYLHGFASGPQSFKARYFDRKFTQLGHSLLIPDLNQDSFSDLTLTRQLHQVQALIHQQPTMPTALIGSSLGGLTAAWLAETCDAVAKLILLAPAFGFTTHWLPTLGQETVQRWQQTGEMPVDHYGYQHVSNLNYAFLEDIRQYEDGALQRQLPTLIIHGVHDDVIPIEASQQFTQHRPWVTLTEVDSDHSLSNVTELMWRSLTTFLNLA